MGVCAEDRSRLLRKQAMAKAQRSSSNGLMSCMALVRVPSRVISILRVGEQEPVRNQILSGGFRKAWRSRCLDLLSQIRVALNGKAKAGRR